MPKKGNAADALEPYLEGGAPPTQAFLSTGRRKLPASHFSLFKSKAPVGQAFAHASPAFIRPSAMLPPKGTSTRT